MNDFFDFLVFIGALYKLAVAIVVASGVFIAVVFVFTLIASFFEWIF